MPRPTLAQLAYGSVTVVGSTLAMLLLSRASSAPIVAVITLAGLALGVFVALTAAAPRQRSGRTVARSTPAAPTAHAPLAPTAGGGTARPLSEHSLPR